MEVCRCNIFRKADDQPVESSNASPVTATADLYSPASIIPDFVASEQAKSPSSPVWESKAPAHQLSDHDIPDSLKTIADKTLFNAKMPNVIEIIDNQLAIM